jgi:hypothetical protein
MERAELVTLVAAILAKGTSEQEFHDAAVAADRLVDYVKSGAYKPPSNWDGNVKFI